MCYMQTQTFHLRSKFQDLYSFYKGIISLDSHSSYPGMFSLVSALDSYLTCPLPYQRNRTPAEYEAACSAHFNPSLSTRSLDVCIAGPAASLAQQPWAKMSLSDLEHVTDPWTRA